MMNEYWVKKVKKSPDSFSGFSLGFSTKFRVFWQDLQSENWWKSRKIRWAALEDTKGKTFLLLPPLLLVHRISKSAHTVGFYRKFRHILQRHIDYSDRFRLGQVQSEFNWKRPKLTRSVRAYLSIFSVIYYSVQLKRDGWWCQQRWKIQSCLLQQWSSSWFFFLSKFESMLLMCLTKAFKSHYSHDFHLRWGERGFQQEEYTLKREIRPRSKQVALQCRQIGFEMVFTNTTLLMDFMGNLAERNESILVFSG